MINEDQHQVPQAEAPTSVIIEIDGTMQDRSGAYDKFLGQMDGVYRDHEAYTALLSQHGEDHLVYRVEENRVGTGPGALILGTSTMRPGRVGEEFAMTRGHLHQLADRAEVYHCHAGRGVMLLDTLDGRSEAIEMVPGVAVHVPGHWVHRSVNVGDEPLMTTFVYAADAGQDYELIARAGGMSQLVVATADGGWSAVRNPDHRGYGEVNL